MIIKSLVMQKVFILRYCSIPMYLLLFISLNIWASRLFFDARIDLTEEKLYSISEVTLEVLRSIKEPIHLRLYVTDNLSVLGPDYLSLKERIENLLEEYKRASNGLLIIEKINPKAFSPEEDLAVSDGVYAIPDVIRGHQVFFGLTGRNSTIGHDTISHFAPERSNFIEYDLTRLIHDLVNTSKTNVAIYGDLPITGDKTRQIPPWTVLDTIKKFFSVNFLFGTIEKFNDNVDVLILADPGDLDQVTLYAIDQFLMRGGRVLAFLDPFNETLNVANSNGPPAPRRTALESMKAVLPSWGLEIPYRTLVGDLDGAAKVQMERDNKIIATDYPVWFETSEKNFAVNDAITHGLSLISFRSAGHIKKLSNSDLKFEPLIWSSDRSGFIDLSKVEYAPDPTKILSELKISDEKYVLMARISGKFKSAFVKGAPARLTNETIRLNHRDTALQSAAVVVISDSDLLNDYSWLEEKDLGGKSLKVPFANNGDLVVNILEHLAGTGSLIGLRAKGVAKRRFRLLEALERKAEVKYRAMEQDLMSRIEEGQKLIAKMKQTEIQRGITYTKDQQIELEYVRNEMINLRKTLREIQFSSRENIEALQKKLKIYNIWLVPVFLGFALIGIVSLKVFRRQRTSSVES